VKYESHAHPPAVLESVNADMARAIHTARQVARSGVSVLLSGESGTGKHLLAAAIHQWSDRAGAPLVTVRRTVPSAPAHEGVVFPSFGSRGEDRWVEAADGGTVFFEEVADLAPPQQATLIQLLDDHRLGGERESEQADIRVIAATARDLAAEYRAGRFRSDLFLRLEAVHITLPPLRERLGDLARLTESLLARFTAQYHRGALRLAPAVRQALARYCWPGNVRELESAIERGVVLSRGNTITTDDLPARLLDAERHHIEEAIRASSTLRQAATRLGIDARTLWRKRKRYGLR